MDLREILKVTRKFQVIILVRHTSELSLPYIGKAGCYPKPVFVKAKTARRPGSRAQQNVGGLVVHPGMRRDCFDEKDWTRTHKAWADTMSVLDAGMAALRVDASSEETLKPWGIERSVRGQGFERWKWRVDINPGSERFGCLQLKCDAPESSFNAALSGGQKPIPWSCLHGDYDLKDVIQPGREGENVVNHEYRGSGIVDCVPQLIGLDFGEIRRAINDGIGVPMCQHGAEAQFDWHGDEPITVAFNDWSFLILSDVRSVMSWYAELHRSVRGTARTFASNAIALGYDGLARDTSQMYELNGSVGVYKAGKHPLTGT